MVEIDALLVTSGQPTVAALHALAQSGFEAVIYLAPLSVSDAVQDEPAILRGQGIAFAHLPIPFAEPTQAHFLSFTELTAGFNGKRLLVHCQVNMRASCMVFLHRVIVSKEPAAAAYEAVSRVWSPRGAWLALLKQQLRKHQIDFEPF